MTATTTVDVGDLTRELCRRLGVEPRTVNSISITYNQAVVAVFQMTDGQPVIVDDEPVIELRTFTIRTI